MEVPKLVIPKIISLKNHATLNERWLHDRLSENPTLLGLGDLEVRDSERRQPGGGRLDLLLQDVETATRYVVEIQLGAMDESHIIRTIDYWDIERRRYRQYDHVAVIVAEDVTSRFLNVVSLLNGPVPLIVIQIKGVEVDGAFTLIATRVVGRTRLGTEEEDEGETTDRGYWEQKASNESLQIMDQFFVLIGEVQSGITPKYNKPYVGLATNGIARNFLTFRPRRAFVLTNFKIEQEEELTTRLDETGLDIVSYDTKWGNYRIRVRGNDIENHRDVFKELIGKARDAFQAR